MYSETMNQEIHLYNEQLDVDDRAICKLLATEISTNLNSTTNKVWHGHPVWFINGNPIVGYAKRKANIQLLFWSGQTFEELDLEPEGTFKAAQKRYTSIDQINIEDLKRWLNKSEAIQWDYKNIIKRRGVLERLA